MPGEEAAAASAAVSDLPGAGAGILSGTDRAADGGNETLSLVSGAGVSASGDGDGGNGGSERQQLAGGDEASNPSSDQSVISYASGERERGAFFFSREVQAEVFFFKGRRKPHSLPIYFIPPLPLPPPNTHTHTKRHLGRLLHRLPRSHIPRRHQKGRAALRLQGSEQRGLLLVELLHRELDRQKSPGHCGALRVLVREEERRVAELHRRAAAGVLLPSGE